MTIKVPGVTTPAPDYVVGVGGTHTSLQTAITDASAGDVIAILPTYSTVEAITMSKKLHIYGEGNASVIGGTVTFSVGAERSSFKYLKFADDVTIDNTVKGIVITDCWLAAGKTVTDNNAVTTDNLYILLEEV